MIRAGLPPLAAFLTMAACATALPEPPAGATRAERIAMLPSVNLDQTLSAFSKVCDAAAPGFADVGQRQHKLRGGRAFLFDAAGGKSPYCSVTARAEDPDTAWRMLKLRYGMPRHVSGGMFVFDRKSNRQLLYQVACEAPGCAERGTYQLAIVPGRKF